MDEIFGKTQTEEPVVIKRACKAINVESMDEELVCGIKKEVFNKVSTGTFCKAIGFKEEDGKRVYNLEDAYGNIKGFDEAQLIGQMQIGTLNVINLEIGNNNKLVKKTPEVLEVTYDNINYLEDLPCLVKIFDQTTEKEGTGVAVGYKHKDNDKYSCNRVIGYKILYSFFNFISFRISSISSIRWSYSLGWIKSVYILLS